MANSKDKKISFLKSSRTSSVNDRLSNLPDVLIHRILSFLPTKQAVATSVLSKRWEWLWTLVPTLDFQDARFRDSDEDSKMKFVHFVYRVLLFNKAVSLEKFRLNCSLLYDHSCMNSWICSAMDRALQEVDISVPNLENEDLVKLPRGFFSSKTLKILKLRGAVLVDVPVVSVCLPNLKILHLHHATYANAKSFRRFISGCLSLEELRIVASFSQVYMMNINVSSPTLKHLSLTLDYEFDSEDDYYDKEDDDLIINAPALQYLNLYSNGTFSLSRNFPLLIEAKIVVEDDGDRIQFLTALANVKCLTLVCNRFFPQEPDSFPFFVNLTRLELHGGVRFTGISLFLQHSLKLETLVVRNKIINSIGGSFKWTQPKKVPTCFLSSLSSACFKDLEGSEEALKMVEYFLKNAKVLRTIQIYTSPKMSVASKHCFLKKLSMFPRSSVICQLSFN